MAYARSKKSVLKLESVLKQLVEAKDDLVFQSLEPHRLAYSIHEALKSAAIYPEFYHYSLLRDKYTIRIKSNKVVAELKSKIIVGETIIREQLGKMTIVEVSDIMGVVGAAVTHKAGEMFFPDAHFTVEGLSELYQWSEPAGYFIINHGDNGLTLTRVHPGEMNWTPKTKTNGNV